MRAADDESAARCFGEEISGSRLVLDDASASSLSVCSTAAADEADREQSCSSNSKRHGNRHRSEVCGHLVRPAVGETSEARALLARNPRDARGLALIQQSQTWNSADAEVTELFAIALANNGSTSQARELLARGDVTVERLIARARVALASSDTSGARALLAQARRLRTSRAVAPASLSQQIEELEAQLRSGA